MASSISQMLNKPSASSGSEGDDIRKRKRMQSNRESARRSRLRKQKHLDDLKAQVTELMAQRHKISSTTHATTRLYLDIEAQNSVLRAQIDELSNRLQSLNDIIKCLSNMAVKYDGQERFDSFNLEFDDEFLMNSSGFSFANCPVVPTLDTFMC